MSTRYNPSIVRDSLLLYLDAANTKSYPGSGTTWYDLSGNSKNPTLTNGPTFNSDNLGSIVLDGTNDMVEFSPGTNITSNTVVLSGSYTASFLFFSSNNGSNSDQMWLCEKNNGGNGLSLYRYQEGNVCIRTMGGNRYSWSCPYRTNIKNKLCFLDFISNGTTMEFYLNNVSQGTVTPNDVTLNVNRLGSNRFADNQALDGRFYNVRFYNRALTRSEIDQNYHALKGRFNL